MNELEAAFLRWRFGDLGQAGPVTELAREILGSEADRQTRAGAALKLAHVLRQTAPGESAEVVRLARSLGAAIPRILATDETATPTVSCEGASVPTVLVDPSATREYEAPRGDPWHPAFDLAARFLPDLKASIIEGGSIAIDATAVPLAFHLRDRGGRLVPKLSSGDKPDDAPELVIEGDLLLIDDVFAGFNVCHLLFDKLPRLAILEPLTRARATVLMFQDHPYVRDVLSDLGYRMVVPDRGRGVISADRLLMLSNHRRGEVMHPGWGGAAWAGDFIRRRLSAAKGDCRRFYVSRADAQVRRPINEDEVRAVFEAHGYEPVVLSGMTYRQQRAMFAQAETIAGVHGAGLANMAFMASGGAIVEIMPPLGGTMAYWVMSQALGHRYTLFTADDAEFDVGPHASFDPALGNRDVRVDIDRLDRMLRAT